ncbi:M16 family metallopeptidase [Coraliomargarita akajimensis]|uniref:Peptidase M16 domain protein n=1 Tax=Coraliomargarita akajimensis (strain DSM 45221 / IAM 15411 / JCM 23193 / KCTC 12865 / 04OKA010-24) TaxID=583355 RepID=D5EMN1_CORAD|nr:pitrilysin family protein [Coraliomargarita akajimensis]ADE53437.1 peptidase M16 domain protein [Coraliomargarita akajimensis DSM 45221]
MKSFLVNVSLGLFATAALTADFDPATQPELPAGVEFVRSLDGIEEYQLSSNGLSILLIPNESLPVASVMVTYQVGSRNEVTGTTGATHILEHMMFKGTDNYNSEDGLKGTDYSNQMERIGARSNATTYFDRTNYYAVLPSEYVPLAIELEADRMRNLRITEQDLASEMTVVRNEYERGENSPVRTLIKEIYAAAFVAQPYGHPTIGWLSDIENTSPEKLRAFYDTYYWPENTYLSIIGGFDRTSTLKAIVEHYGSISSAPQAIPQVDTIEPEQLGARRLQLERAGQVGVVAIAYKVPEGTHKDWAALWLLEQIIGADKTGRLYRALEDQGKASATFTFAPQLRDPSLFFFAAYLTPDATHEDTEAIMLQEIQKVIANGVSEDELQRAKAVIRAETVYGRDGPYMIASELNEAIAMGDWSRYIDLPKEIESVSAEELQRVAKDYFVTRRSTTGWFVPQTPTASLSKGSSRMAGIQYFRDPELGENPIVRPERNQAQAAGTAVGKQVDFASQMQRTQIGPIDLVAIDMPIQDVVSFVGSFAAGSSKSPSEQPMLASLTASMLDKGTEKNDRFAIAERLDSLGASIEFDAGAHSLGFSGKFLSKDAGIIMSMLAEQLRSPAFDAEVLATLKARQKASLLHASQSTDFLADAAISRQLYSPEHPNYQAPIEELIADLEATDISAIKAFHSEFYGPASMQLVFVGDVDFDQLSAAVETAFGDWSGGADYTTTASGQLGNRALNQEIVVEDKASVSVRYAHNTGLRRTDDDYLPFMVGNYILGGSFHSRLMTEVRKNRGLTYDVRSGHSGDIMTAGHWTLSASFAPSMMQQGLQATKEVVEEWHAKGVTEAEVEAAIQTLSGSYMVRLSTTGSVAGQVHSFLQRGLPADYVDRYPERLRAITVDQVNAAIRQYVDPAKLIRVEAGSLTPAATTQESPAKVSVRLDAPDAGWSIQIERIYQIGTNLAVISNLVHTGAPSAQTITTVADTVAVPHNVEGLKVRHYVLGKTWNWGESDDYQFLESLDSLEASLKSGTQIYPTM